MRGTRALVVALGVTIVATAGVAVVGACSFSEDGGGSSPETDAGIDVAPAPAADAGPPGDAAGAADATAGDAGPSPGTLDPSFGDGGVRIVGEMQAAAGLGVLSDGQVVIAGFQTVSPNTNQDVPVLTFLGQGDDSRPATTLSPTGLASVELGGLFVDDQDRVTVCGAANPLLNSVGDGLVARFFADGTPDPAFGKTGAGYTLVQEAGSGTAFAAVAPASNGQVVVTGVDFAAGNGQSVLFRFDSDGKYQASGSSDHEPTSIDLGTSIVTTSSDEVFFASSLVTPPTGGPFWIDRASAGTAAPTSTKLAGATAVYGLAHQPSRHGLIAAGFDGTVGFVRRYATQTLLADAAFVPPPTLALSVTYFSAVAVQPQDDKILLFGFNQATASLVVARLLPDGDADTSFGAGGVAVIAVEHLVAPSSIALDPDGHRFVVSFLATVGDVRHGGVVRMWR